MVWAELAQVCGLTRPAHLREPWFYASLLAPVGFWFVLRWFTASGPSGSETRTLSFLLSVLLWQPILEEVCFRGLLQGVLLERLGIKCFFGGITTANAVTSTVFGLTHLLNHPWPWALGTCFVSLLFGYARERTGSLFPSIMLHSYYNAVYFLLAPS